MNKHPNPDAQEDNIELLDVSGLSPYSQAIYEIGKSMLIDSLETGREFCKFMTTFSISAIPIYLGLLTFIIPENYVLGSAAGLTISLPAIAFLTASVVFALGYLPTKSKISLELIEEIEKERNRIIQRRSVYITIGVTVFILACLAAIYVVIINIGTR